MKIVYFNYMWDLWGASIGSTIKALELLKALSNCGHEIKDYWMRDDLSRKNFERNYSDTSIKTFLKRHLGKYLREYKQLFKNFNSIKKEIEIIEKEKPDLIISRLDVYVYSPIFLSKKFDIPVLIEVDSPRSYEKLKYQPHPSTTKSLLKWMEIKSILSGKASFTVSNQIKEHFVNRGIPESLLTVIPNGAGPALFSPETPFSKIVEKYNLQDCVVVGFVGSFIFWHGVENLTYIIEKTVEKYNNVKYLMVGQGGPMEFLIRKFIADNKLEEKVILTGFVPHNEVPNYITAMDIVIAPYPEMEFFYYSPVKIYEYMSCGKPVISTRIGQIEEIIEDRKTGFLTKPNDIEQISSIISELIENEKLRKNVGMAARNEILEKHTWQKRGEQLAELCEKYVQP